MSNNLRRFLSTACFIAVVGASAALGATPAIAGGDGTVYVYGATLSNCRTNLTNSITLYRHYGYQVTGVDGCRKTGDGRRYFGDFVAN